jgi:aspartate-semialdehyde dehydrogenase
MVATSYQAAGGAGQSGITELLEQAAKLVETPSGCGCDGARWRRSAWTPEVFSKAIAFNVLAHCGNFTDERYTDEEWKLVNESRKILGIPALRVSPTCVRVPVVVGHSIAARLTFAEPVSRDAAMAALRDAPGMQLVDGTASTARTSPTRRRWRRRGATRCSSAAIREDLGDPHSLNLFVSATTCSRAPPSTPSSSPSWSPPKG